ncbi:MAG TPA: hypothetical protein VME47_15420 [Acetobacteraceae bacterium]|nr:hypothetical protein [Acetobacteraceae bacterium]
MTSVSVIAPPSLEGQRLAFVLAEDRLGHYAEFREFVTRAFDLDRIGLARPGFLRAPSGGIYALVFIGRSGEAFPSGVEIHAVVPALEPLDEAHVDGDLWAILQWVVTGVGRDWTVEALQATGRLFRIPPAMPEPA